jgi:hypothetical protein
MSRKILSRPLGLIPGIGRIASDLTDECRRISEDAHDDAHEAFAVNGGWFSTPLMNKDGDPESSKTYVFAPPGKWIPNVKKNFPTIYGLAQTVFDIDKALSVRVFMIKPNSGIRLHADYFELDFGKEPTNYLTRIHAVVRTNPAAMNGEGRFAYHMPFGTVWFLEARDRLAHWAANFGNEPRYHLVADFLGIMRPEDCVCGLDRFEDVELQDRPAIPEDVKETIANKARAPRRQRWRRSVTRPIEPICGGTAESCSRTTLCCRGSATGPIADVAWSNCGSSFSVSDIPSPITTGLASQAGPVLSLTSLKGIQPCVAVVYSLLCAGRVQRSTTAAAPSICFRWAISPRSAPDC